VIQIDSYSIIGPLESTGNRKYSTYKALKNGNPPEQGEFSLFPSGKSVQLKTVSPIEDTRFFMIEVKGVVASGIRKDALLLSASYGAVEGKKALVIWKGTPPDGRGLDLKLRDLPDYRIKSKISSSRSERVSQISGREPFLQLPGQIYHFSDSRDSFECVMLMADPFTPDQVKQMMKRVNKFGNFPGPESIYSMNLRVRGFAQLPDSLMDSEFEGAYRKGHWFIMSRMGDRMLTTIEKRSKSETGIRESELPALLDCPQALVQELVQEMVLQEKLFRKTGFLVNRTDKPEQFLSPMTRSFLEELRKHSTDGMSLKDVAAIRRDDLPDILQRRGLARKLETLLFSEEAYKELVGRVLEILPKVGTFDLSDLTGVSDLSRGRLLQMLDEMEKDGLLRSTGDNRRELV